MVWWRRPSEREADEIGRTLTLTPGTRLGVFELVGLLGRGGMGEVYPS